MPRGSVQSWRSWGRSTRSPWGIWRRAAAVYLTP